MPATTLPATGYLRDCFSYDSDRGGLVWLRRPTRHFSREYEAARLATCFAGGQAGSPDMRGYWRVHLDSKTYSLHRLVWKVVYGTEPPPEIDHIDRNRANNRIENLRPATRSQNCLNTGVRSDNTSGFKGVDWHQGQKRWRARIFINGKSQYLGMFDHAEDAAHAYLVAFCDYHGPCLAFPPDHRDALEALIADMVKRDVRAGARDIPGVEVIEERVAV